ncbi:hypothetical protein H8E52_09645 [bacterium]|nr:hypothetical protein [bacterium]
MAAPRLRLFFGLLLLAVGLLAEGPCVVRVEPARSGDQLVADLEFENLFPRPIENTLKSGLPIVIDCLIEMDDHAGEDPRGIVLRSELGYDVWDGIFSLRRGEMHVSFEDFLALQQACDHLTALPLAKLSDLPPAATFHIHMRVAVSPFGGEDADRVARWLSETVSDSRDPNSREFRVDLGGLIDGFFRSTGRNQHWGESRSFGPYRLDKLQEIAVIIPSIEDEP